MQNESLKEFNEALDEYGVSLDQFIQISGSLQLLFMHKVIKILCIWHY